MDKKDMTETAVRVSLVTIAINAALAAAMLLAGVFSGSAAIVSDAVNTASDVFSTLIVIISVKLAGREADSDHPYGHERFESVAAILLSAILLATGLAIGYGGVRAVFSGAHAGLDVAGAAGAAGIAAALVSVGAKEWMYRYTKAAAERVNSEALKADAWHHRSDALSSAGSFAGILGARLGLPVLDSVAGVVISLLVIKAAVSIFKDAVSKLTDRACDEETEGKIREVVLRQEGVCGIDLLRTRRFGNRVYVDVEISADGDQPLSEGHEVTHRVHDALEAAFPEIKHCMVHVNPAREGGADEQ